MSIPVFLGASKHTSTWVSFSYYNMSIPGGSNTQVPGVLQFIIHEYSWGLQAHKSLGVLQLLYMSIPGGLQPQYWGPSVLYMSIPAPSHITWVSFSYYTLSSWGVLQAHSILVSLQLLYMSIPGAHNHIPGAPSTQLPGCPSVIIHEYSWGLQAHKYLGVLQLLYMSIPWGSKHTSTWLSFSYYT